MNLDFNCSLEDLLGDDDFIRHTLAGSIESPWKGPDVPDDFRRKLEQARQILLGETLDYRMEEQESRDLKNAIFVSLNLKRSDWSGYP